MRTLATNEITAVAGSNALDTVTGSFNEPLYQITPEFNCVVDMGLNGGNLANTTASVLFGPFGEAIGLTDYITAIGLVVGTAYGLSACENYSSWGGGGGGGAGSLNYLYTLL